MTAATSLSLGCIPVSWRALVNRLTRRMQALDERLQMFLCYVCNSYPRLKLSQTWKWGTHLNLWLSVTMTPSEQCPHQQPHPDVFFGDYDSLQANVRRKVADMEKQVTHCENTARAGLPNASPGNYLLLLLVSNSRAAPILLLIILQK